MSDRTADVKVARAIVLMRRTVSFPASMSTPAALYSMLLRPGLPFDALKASRARRRMRPALLESRLGLADPGREPAALVAVSRVRIEPPQRGEPRLERGVMARIDRQRHVREVQRSNRIAGQELESAPLRDDVRARLPPQRDAA